MARRGHKVIHRPHEGTQFMVGSGELDDMVRDADVVLAGRMHHGKAFASLMAGRDLYGYKLIVDTDDDIDSLPEYNQAFPDYHEGTGVARVIRNEYRAADLVTVSTAHLANQVAKYCQQPPVVIPNVIDPRMWEGAKRREKEPRHRDDLRIYWGGGAGHYADLLLVRDVLLRIFHERPNVKLVFSYFLPDWAVDLPAFRCLIVPFAPFGAYPKVLRWTCADVAIAPLVDNLFNRSKSHVKYLNYAMGMVPGVYSSLLPYESVEHGWTGLKAANGDEWHEGISGLLDDAELRQRIARNAYEDVMANWTVDSHAGRYETMLEEAISAPKVGISALTEGVPVEAACLTTR